MDISINHGPWQNVISYTNNTQGTAVHNISPWAADHSDVRIRFHYTASYDWWWKIDSVMVYSHIPDRIEDLTICRSDTTAGTGSVTLSWSSFPGTIQYHIYKSTDNWQSGFSRIASTAVTSFIDSTAAP